MDKELIFKKAIVNHLEPILEQKGYKADTSFKGLLQFKSQNNILTFVYEWNSTYGIYSVMRFDKELNDYPIDLILQRSKNVAPEDSPIFQKDFNVLVNNWAADLALQFSQIEIEKITKDSSIIMRLRQELDSRNEKYTEQLILKQIKERVDRAWNCKEYEVVVAQLSDWLPKLPPPYSKKFEIAKKKLSA